MAQFLTTTKSIPLSIPEFWKHIWHFIIYKENLQHSTVQYSVSGFWTIFFFILKIFKYFSLNKCHYRHRKVLLIFVIDSWTNSPYTQQKLQYMFFIFKKKHMKNICLSFVLHVFMTTMKNISNLCVSDCWINSGKTTE